MSFPAMFAAAALALSASQTGAAASASAEPDAAEPATTVEEVTVRAAQRRTISEFVRDLSDETREGKLARWNKTICPATLGLPQRYGQYLNDRLGVVARDAGLKVAEPGCRPDILIVVTDEADQLLAELAAEHKDLFAARRWSYERTSAGGSQSFESFIQTPRPVRWWHVAESVPADGQPFLDDGRTVRVQPSRLRATMREDFAFVIIVVDAKLARGVTYQALSDYVAMAALAQLNPNVSVDSVPTVLNVFDDLEAGRTPAEGLTEWDRAYLKGLYAARDDAPDSRSQRGRIVRGIQRGGWH